jgi:hypothetical protein
VHPKSAQAQVSSSSKESQNIATTRTETYKPLIQQWSRAVHHTLWLPFGVELSSDVA